MVMTLTVCTNPPPSVAAGKPKASTEPLKDTVVRIYVGGSYAGSGVVVSKDGHVVASLRTVLNRLGNQSTSVLSVDDGTVRARIIGQDASHDLVLLKADRTYRSVAVMGGRDEARSMEAAVIIGYTEILGEPPFVEKRVLEGFVTQTRYQGESVSGLDFGDTSLVGIRDSERNRVKEAGSAVFLAESRKLLGLGIGKMWSGNELVVMPADTIRLLLVRSGVRTGDAGTPQRPLP
jgi:hypothetical protein